MGKWWERGDLHPELILGRDMRLLASITQQIQDEFRNVTTGDRNMLDRGSDDVSIGDGDRICREAWSNERNEFSMR
jgi:hypothetical protein